MFSIIRKSEPMLDRYMTNTSEARSESADYRLKRYLITEHETLTAKREHLLSERRFIEQQIAEHDRAIDAIGAALSSFEMADRIQDAFTEDAANWSLDVDATPSAAYNDASTTTKDKSDGM